MGAGFIAINPAPIYATQSASTAWARYTSPAFFMYGNKPRSNILCGPEHAAALREPRPYGSLSRTGATAVREPRPYGMSGSGASSSCPALRGTRPFSLCMAIKPAQTFFVGRSKPRPYGSHGLREPRPYGMSGSWAHQGRGRHAPRSGVLARFFKYVKQAKTTLNYVLFSKHK